MMSDLVTTVVVTSKPEIFPIINSEEKLSIFRISAKVLRAVKSCKEQDPESIIGLLLDFHRIEHEYSREELLTVLRVYDRVFKNEGLQLEAKYVEFAENRMDTECSEEYLYDVLYGEAQSGRKRERRERKQKNPFTEKNRHILDICAQLARYRSVWEFGTLLDLSSQRDLSDYIVFYSEWLDKLRLPEDDIACRVFIKRYLKGKRHRVLALKLLTAMRHEKAKKMYCIFIGRPEGRAEGLFGVSTWVGNLVRSYIVRPALNFAMREVKASAVKESKATLKDAWNSVSEMCRKAWEWLCELFKTVLKACKFTVDMGTWLFVELIKGVLTLVGFEYMKAAFGKYWKIVRDWVCDKLGFRPPKDDDPPDDAGEEMKRQTQLDGALHDWKKKMDADYDAANEKRRIIERHERTKEECMNMLKDMEDEVEECAEVCSFNPFEQKPYIVQIPAVDDPFEGVANSGSGSLDDSSILADCLEFLRINFSGVPKWKFWGLVGGLPKLVSIGKAIQWIFENMERVWGWFMETWTGEPRGRNALEKDILAYGEKISRFYQLTNSDAVDDVHGDECTALANELGMLKKGLEMRMQKAETHRPFFAQLFAQKNLVYNGAKNLFEIKKKSAKPRACPVWVNIMGPPGVGKSRDCPQVRQYVWDYLREFADFWPKREITSADTFIMNQGSEYWDGYGEQLFWMLDDLWQITDVDRKKVVALQFINMVTSEPYSLLVADMNKKSSVYFTSRVMFTTSNDMNEIIKNTALVDPTALSERVTVSVIMHGEDDYELVHGCSLPDRKSQRVTALELAQLVGELVLLREAQKNEPCKKATFQNRWSGCYVSKRATLGQPTVQRVNKPLNPAAYFTPSGPKPKPRRPPPPVPPRISKPLRILKKFRPLVVEKYQVDRNGNAESYALSIVQYIKDVWNRDEKDRAAEFLHRAGFASLIPTDYLVPVGTGNMMERESEQTAVENEKGKEKEVVEGQSEGGWSRRLLDGFIVADEVLLKALPRQLSDRLLAKYPCLFPVPPVTEDLMEEFFDTRTPDADDDDDKDRVICWENLRFVYSKSELWKELPGTSRPDFDFWEEAIIRVKPPMKMDLEDWCNVEMKPRLVPSILGAVLAIVAGAALGWTVLQFMIPASAYDTEPQGYYYPNDAQKHSAKVGKPRSKESRRSAHHPPTKVLKRLQASSQAEGSDDVVYRLIHENSDIIETRVGPKGSTWESVAEETPCTSWCLFIGGRVAICPLHVIFGSGEDDDERYVSLVRFAKQTWHVRDLEVKTFRGDLAFVTFPFASEKRRLDGHFAVSFPKGGIVDHVQPFTNGTGCKTTPSYGYEKEIVPCRVDEDYVYETDLIFNGIRTYKGMCGTVYVHRKTGKIVAIHQGGRPTMDQGLGVLILKEDIERHLPQIDIQDPIPCRREACNILPGTETRGMAEANFGTYMPTDTNLQKSKFNLDDFPFPPTDASPAHLKPEGGKSPLKNFFLKYGMQEVVPSLDLLAVVDDFLPKNFNPDNVDEISIEEAIFGDPDRGIEPVDFTTSAGYFYKKMGFTRRDLCWRDGQPFIHPILRRDVEQLMEGYQTGRVRPVVYEETLKDELRSPAKNADFQTRLFASADFASLIAQKMVFCMFLKELTKDPVGSPCCVTINPHSRMWGDMYELLRGPDGNNDLTAGDAEQFDIGVKNDAKEDWVRLCSKWHPNPTRVRYAKEALHCGVSVCGRLLYVRPWGTHSGGYDTAAFNSFANWRYHKLAFLEQYTEEDWKQVVPRVLGDDSIVGVPKKFNKFNMNYIKEYLWRTRRVKYTSPTKTDEMFVDWDSVQFLKRKFVLGHAGVMAPLAEKSVSNSVTWTDAPGDMKVMESVVNSVLLEAFHYGRERYEACYQWAVKEARRCNSRWIFPDWTGIVALRKADYAL